MKKLSGDDFESWFGIILSLMIFGGAICFLVLRYVHPAIIYIIVGGLVFVFSVKDLRKSKMLIQDKKELKGQ